MARKQWQSGVNYVFNSSYGLPGTSFSASFWIYITSNVAATRNIYRFIDSASANLVNIGLNTSGTAFFNDFNGTDAIGNTANTVNLNAWNNIVFVKTSVTSRRLALNNGTQVSNTTTTRNGPTGTGATVFLGNAGLAPELGWMDYPAVWKTALSDSDITSLQTKFPSSVQPSSLYSYWPLEGASPEIDNGVVSTQNFLIFGTPTADNSSVGRPSLTAGTGNINRLIYYYNMMRG